MGNKQYFYSNFTKKVFLVNIISILILSSACSMFISSGQLESNINCEIPSKTNRNDSPTILETTEINGSNILPVNRWDEDYYFPTKMKAKEGLLVYINSFGGAVIINTTIEQSPVVISTIGEEGQQIFSDLYIDDDILYICDQDSTFKAFNISNPENPLLIDELSIDYAYTVEVVDNIAYILNYDGDLYSVDISNPSDLQIIGWHDIGVNANCLFVRDNILFVGLKSGGLTICNISSPSNITVISTYNSDAYIGGENIWIEGNTAFITEEQEGLDIVNITDLENPTFISRYNTTEEMNVKDIIIFESIAYLGDMRNNLALLDITNLTNLVKIESMENCCGTSEFTSTDDCLIANTNAGNIVFINISNHENPVTISTFITTGFSKDVVIKDSLAFIANVFELSIVDISVQNIRPVSQYSDNYIYNSIFIENDLLFLSNYYRHYITIVNISSPRTPLKLSNFEFEDNSTKIRSVFVKDEKVYLACEDRGLIILDVSNPQSPVTIGNFSLNSIIAVEVRDYYAYIIDEIDGLVVLDVVNPNNIISISSLEMDIDFEPHHLTIDDNYVYLLGNSDMYIVNIKHPELPKNEGSVKSYNGANDQMLDFLVAPPGEIVVRNNLAFATDLFGLYLFDISNKNDPLLAGYYFDETESFGLCVDETYIYVAKGDHGLVLYRSLINPRASLGTGWIILIVSTSTLIITVPLMLFIRKRKMKIKE